MPTRSPWPPEPMSEQGKALREHVRKMNEELAENYGEDLPELLKAAGQGKEALEAKLAMIAGREKNPPAEGKPGES